VLIAIYILAANATGAGRVISSLTAGTSGVVKSLQGRA